MDKILVGLVFSKQPVSVKKYVVTQIANSGKNDLSEDSFRAMLHACYKYIFPETREIESLHVDFNDMLKTVVKAWISHNEIYTRNFINNEYFITPLHEISKDRKVLHMRYLLFTVEVYYYFHNYQTSLLNKTLKQYQHIAFQHVNDIKILSLLCKCYIEYPFLVPQHLSLETKEKVLGVFVKVFGTIPMSDYLKSQANTEVSENYIYLLLSTLIKDDIETMKVVANHIFKLLSKEGKQPSACIAKLLIHLKLELFPIIMDELTKMNLSDDTLTRILSTMVDWVCLPDPELVADQWIIQYMKYLMKYQKYQVLFSVVEGKIKQLIHLIFIPVFRKNAISLATFMLISYLHSPKPFHQVCTIIPGLIKHLKDEVNDNTQIIKVIVELMFSLMYHFPGYPDVYSTLLNTLQEYSKPAEASMKSWLQAGFLISPVELPKYIVHERKSETGKVGLNNLGNTCYANSVIQALFNLKIIKKRILEEASDITTSHPLTKCLQEMFVLLHLSKRPSIAPRTFLDLSRPPWFQKGFQQDCSEYLKFLLDKLQVESCGRTYDINNLLSGQIRTSVKCLHCGFVSDREELFNDLPLSFYESSEPVEQTLKGGDSSDRLKRKIDCSLTNSQDTKQTVTENESVNSITEELSSSLPEREKFSIKDMLSSYLTAEYLRDSNKYFCEKCSALQNAMKTIEVTDFPNYLILTMKRFTYNVTTQKRSKLLHLVEHPQMFATCGGCTSCRHGKVKIEDSIEGQSSSRGLYEEDRNEQCEGICNFRLLSVIVHSGHSSDSGHYYSYTCEYEQDDTVNWFLLNDSRVTKAPRDCIVNLSTRFPLDTPYVCIYEKFVRGGQNIQCDIDVQKSLLEYVQSDDALYSQELQRDTLRKQKSFLPSRRENDDDDNDDGSSGGSCRPMGDFGSAKFVF